MSGSSETDLEKLTPPKNIEQEQRRVIFEHIYRRLAIHRNDVERFAMNEGFVCPKDGKEKIREDFVKQVNKWANDLLENIWMACSEPASEKPTIDAWTDSSLRDLPPLPDEAIVTRFLNTVLLLHITSTKHYSAHARAFLLAFSSGTLDEAAATHTLKNPKEALKDAEKHAEDAKNKQAKSNKVWRAVGMGSAAVVGGVLVGVTGGLAAPLVGAGISTVFGILGVGGSAAGVLAAGLAGSSAVCGCLFGAYGAKSGYQMISRHTRDVADFAVVPVREPKDTLAVRICISGWLRDKDDVTAPWTVFDDSEDTLALQWEVEALEELSSALSKLVTSHAISLVRSELLRHTFLAALTTALAPIALLKLGQIVDNPWANAKALAIKTGHVLATLLASRAFGTRPISLTGYSLGALVILTALEDLSAEEAEKSVHVVQDVVLMGTPASAGGPAWVRARRVVAGRFVNAYTDAESDYVLAFLQRASVTDAVRGTLGVAGLQSVEVAGVENVKVEGVEGHVAWRGLVGKCLQMCEVRGIREDEVRKQMETVGEEIKAEVEEGLNGKGTEVDEEIARAEKTEKVKRKPPPSFSDEDQKRTVSGPKSESQ